MRITLLVACLWLATNTLNAKIVFRSKRDGRHEIYTMNSDGTNPTRVTFMTRHLLCHLLGPLMDDRLLSIVDEAVKLCLILIFG